MKKLSLVVLLGIALSAMVTGCNKEDSTPATTTPPAASTNTPSTNAP